MGKAETQEGASAKLHIYYQENADLMRDYQLEKWLKRENIQG